MVRENRIKEYRFASQTFSVSGGDLTLYSDYPLNGDILEVDLTFNRTGSVWLTFSGTGEEFFRRNAPSGASITITQPRKFTQDFKIGSIANAEHVPFVCNDKIVLNVLNTLSGTQTLDVNVRYR